MENLVNIQLMFSTIGNGSFCHWAFSYCSSNTSSKYWCAHVPCVKLHPPTPAPGKAFGHHLPAGHPPVSFEGPHRDLTWKANFMHLQNAIGSLVQPGKKHLVRWCWAAWLSSLYMCPVIMVIKIDTHRQSWVENFNIRLPDKHLSLWTLYSFGHTALDSNLNNKNKRF